MSLIWTNSSFWTPLTLKCHTGVRIIKVLLYYSQYSDTDFSECLRVMTEELLSKSRTKKKAWNYFGLWKGADEKLLDNGSDVCWTCHIHVKKNMVRFYNLIFHLKTNHPEVMKSCRTPWIKSTTLLPAALFTIQESIKHAQK